MHCLSSLIVFYYFRVIVLQNGLKALLISDIDPDAESSSSSESDKGPASPSPADNVRF